MVPSILFLFAFILSGCEGDISVRIHQRNNSVTSHGLPSTIQDIPPPEKFERLVLSTGSFGDWLRNIALKKDRHVYLYNGALKRNQQAQFAVLEKPVGNKDLQQCADAVMRLWAEYLFSCQQFSEIVFKDNNDTPYSWNGNADSSGFDRYLQTVFAKCGSASLQRQLTPVNERSILPGDVFIKGGFPGHAMLVVDVAVNREGERMFMLAQGFMPAQDIHIVKNPVDNELSPWYRWNEQTKIVTPEWTFERKQLYSF